MKRETMRHPKTWDLASRLDCSRPEALGYLTLLWDFAAEHAPQGNLGKWPDGAIARACDWPGDPGAFVAALVDSGWLDRDPDHRLLVHHWWQHKEHWISAKLARAGLVDLTAPPGHNASANVDDNAQSALDPTPGRPLERSGTAIGGRPLEPSSPRDQSKPNQTKIIPVRSGMPPGSGMPGGTDPLDDFRAWPELADEAMGEPYPRPPNAGRLSRSGIFTVLADRHLSEPRSLREWLIRQAAAPKPLLEATPQSLVALLALAEHVKSIPRDRIKRSRIAAFVKLASVHRWGLGKPHVLAALEQLEGMEAQEAMRVPGIEAGILCATA